MSVANYIVIPAHGTLCSSYCWLQIGLAPYSLVLVKDLNIQHVYWCKEYTTCVLVKDLNIQHMCTGLRISVYNICVLV